MISIRSFCLSWLGALVFVSPSIAADLTFDHGWARPTAALQSSAAVFAVVANHGTHEIILVGGYADFAERVAFHQSTIEDGQARMQPLSGGLTIPAGETVFLEPGGLHIMLFGLASRLVEGNQHTLTLTSIEGETVEVDVTIQSPFYQGHLSDDSDHSHHDHDTHTHTH